MRTAFQSLSRALNPKPRPIPVPRTAPIPRTFATTSSKMGSTTTTPAATANADTFLELIKARRSVYPLNKDLPIATSRVQTIVAEALQHIPSSFNSQSNRAVVLFGAEHDRLWDITSDVLKAIVPADQWEATAQRMAMFKGAAGTVFFFEDQTVVEDMQARFPLYADRFPSWAGHSSAMLQFAVWTALEAEGLGANLQHYNPLIDVKVAEAWKLPATWKLIAQMPFGGRTVAEAREKTFLPLEEKFKVFGA